MSFMNNILSKGGVAALAIGALMALSPMKADAAVVGLSDGDVIDPIVVGDLYTFEDQIFGNTGALSRSFTFVADSADAPLPVIASSLTLSGFGGTIVDPFLSWDDGTVTTFATITDLGTGFKLDLATLFTDPDKLTQVLSIGWSSFTGRSAQISLQVSAVPLPAGGLLLLTALGGMAIVRRRRKAA